jgi:hypothetical protein
MLTTERLMLAGSVTGPTLVQEIQTTKHWTKLIFVYKIKYEVSSLLQHDTASLNDWCHIPHPIKTETSNTLLWKPKLSQDEIPYILESNAHPFYSFRGLKNQVRIRFACGLDSRSRAGFWKNDWAAVRAVRTIQYNTLLFYYLLL